MQREAFTRTLKALRKRKGIAQEKLAQLAGIDRGYMGELERAEHMPTLITLLRILAAMNVTLVQFAVEYESQLRALDQMKDQF